MHAETDIDAAGASVVAEALNDADRVLGGLAGRSAVIVGAGSMGGLAAASLRRAGIGDVVIANRTEANGTRLAASLTAEGVPARAIGLDRARRAHRHRRRAARLHRLDGRRGRTPTRSRAASPAAPSGVPWSSATSVCPGTWTRPSRDLPGVTVVDLETLRDRLADAPTGRTTDRAAAILAEEVRGYLAAQRSAEVTPTVTALRRRAAEVVDAELLRLDSRLPELDEQVRGELAKTVRRVVDKLLHTPTVRVKQLASAPGGASYADALRELFELDPKAAAAVSAAAAIDGPAVVHEGLSLDGASLAANLAKLDGVDGEAPA